MRIENLPSPGVISLSQQLRTFAARAISNVETVAAVTAGGKTLGATTLKAFFEACATALNDIVAAAPANTVVPAISGTETVGSTLTRTTGTWTGDATITFATQWQRLVDAVWVDIAGATAATYVLAAADLGKRVRVRVIGSNNVSEGEVAAFSAQSGVIA